MSRWLVVALSVVGLLYLSRSILGPFIVAGALAYMFSPIVDELQDRTRVSRAALSLALVLILLTFMAFGVWILETRLVAEIRALGDAGPDIVDAAFVRTLGAETVNFLGQPLDPHDLAARTNEALNDFLGSPTDALHIAERALDALVKTLLTFLAFFYMLLDGRRFGAYVLHFIPTEHRPHVVTVAERIHVVLGRFLRGQLFLIFLMSLVTFLVLELVFHLPFALPIAVLTGILEVIPLIGPVVAGTIASSVALVNGGPAMAVSMIVAYTVLRQVEDQVVMPVIVGRSVHLHPLVTTFAVLVGGTSAGVLGAIMAVPVAAALRVTLDYAFPSSRSHEDMKPTMVKPTLPVKAGAKAE
jgi:predicted PurR-regulated permease PerM